MRSACVVLYSWTQLNGVAPQLLWGTERAQEKPLKFRTGNPPIFVAPFPQFLFVPRLFHWWSRHHLNSIRLCQWSPQLSLRHPPPQVLKLLWCPYTSAQDTVINHIATHGIILGCKTLIGLKELTDYQMRWNVITHILYSRLEGYIILTSLRIGNSFWSSFGNYQRNAENWKNKWNQPQNYLKPTAILRLVTSESLCNLQIPCLRWPKLVWPTVKD